jgi:hypothetical protein
MERDVSLLVHQIRKTFIKGNGYIIKNMVSALFIGRMERYTKEISGKIKCMERGNQPTPIKMAFKMLSSAIGRKGN